KSLAELSLERFEQAMVDLRKSVEITVLSPRWYEICLFICLIVPTGHLDLVRDIFQTAKKKERLLPILAAMNCLLTDNIEPVEKLSPELKIVVHDMIALFRSVEASRTHNRSTETPPTLVQ